MNRDEQLSRPVALAPKITEIDGVRCVYPREASGGTWIAANAAGITFALLNRNLTHSKPRRSSTASPKPTSRGQVIPQLLPCLTDRAASLCLRQMDLSRTPAFRLIGVFPGERLVREWNWDGAALVSLKLPWKNRHWFSSSLGDDRAQAQRAEIVKSALVGHTSNSRAALGAAWLRRLHRAHGAAPATEPGPFSICVHRPEVGTISYNEIRCQPDQIRCYYLPGPPCCPSGTPSVSRLSRPAV